MGELKGQILGILLVLMVFGGLIATYSGIFSKAENTISSRVDNYVDTETLG